MDTAGDLDANEKKHHRRNVQVYTERSGIKCILEERYRVMGKI